MNVLIEKLEMELNILPNSRLAALLMFEFLFMIFTQYRRIDPTFPGGHQSPDTRPW